jgi:hypothetical protein
MFEHRSQPLLPLALWRQRLARSMLLAGAIIAVTLAIGVAGYHYLGRLAWIDALLDAAMILSGMGPMNPLTTVPGKLFATVYALFSGLIFIGSAGVLAAPWLHRLLHSLHAEPDDDAEG